MSETNFTAAPQGGLLGLGAALLRAAARYAEGSGLTLPESVAPTMEALMGAFARAEDRGSVCIRAEGAAQRLGSAADDADPARAGASGLARLQKGLADLVAVGLAQNLADFLDAARAEARQPGTGRFAPIVVDEAGDFAESRIYFARFAFEEVMLAQALLGLAGDAAEPIPEEMRRKIDATAALAGADALQRRAVELALERRFAVVSGGPGTGKTTTVAQILECLLAQNPDLRIALAAPTGKAAGRMDQSIRQSVGRGFAPVLAAALAADALRPEGERRIRARTIHKWLLTPTAAGAFPGPGNPIPADVLVVDEASMVDIHWAARLFAAVSEGARVVVLGDKHQLAAVGPGAVFADISDADGALAACAVELKTSHRFRAGGVIARLADAVNHQGDAADLPESEVFARVLAALNDLPAAPTSEDPHPASAKLHDDDAEEAALDEDERRAQKEAFNRTGLTRGVRRWLARELDGYAAQLERYRLAWQAGADDAALHECARGLWGALSQFRVLAAQRRGAMSVAAVNDAAGAEMRARWPIESVAGGENYPGRVVIVRRNDDGLSVYNGDVGIVLPAAQTGDGAVVYRVYFGDADRMLPAALLPAHDTAWAITIHQSQGSEFERVAVLLPRRPGSGLATRELLYTGITRTKAEVDIFGRRDVLAETVRRPTVREGGLAARLRLGRF
ncbi:exodeoxyribonuclease V subunit alpha [uncultured Sutterella sp.]|uniref:exodeoxyribonuclease V subunit alpha n=1 Tax=uncultured Sutterella sp. TaxID=286133 RepID=UPI0025D0E54C|nr:exodeoxyribonuclease V subunit alpha [uncultured Sutterella sp.]